MMGSIRAGRIVVSLAIAAGLMGFSAPAAEAAKAFPRYDPSTSLCRGVSYSDLYDSGAWQIAAASYRPYRPTESVDLGLRDKYGSYPGSFPVKVRVRTPSGRIYSAWTRHDQGDGFAYVRWSSAFGAPRYSPPGVYTVLWEDAKGRDVVCSGFVIA